MRSIVILALAFAALAGAADHPQEARKLVLKKSSSGKSALAWVATLPAPVLPSASPTAIGATFYVEAESGEQSSMTLPAGGWIVNEAGTTYKYKNGDAGAGPSPVKVAVLRGGKTIKLSARSSGLGLDQPAQGTVAVRLVVGTDAYCSTCTVAMRDEPGRYVARRCPAPAACLSLVATTTTTVATTSTTSTTVPATCGNAVAEPPGEQCDGTDPGVCDDVAVPFGVGCDAPGTSNECRCCGVDTCIYWISGPPLVCCSERQCQITQIASGVGAAGVCIPPSCAQPSDCPSDYQCIAGTCCAAVGRPCGAAPCCPGTGAVCTAGAYPIPVCCLPPGSPCGTGSDCCLGTCTGGLCD